MKLSSHTLLSLRIEMTQLGYKWKTDPEDRSLGWQVVDHWELWDPPPGGDSRCLALHPVVSCNGQLYTTDVACSVLIHPDQTLSGWLLTESYAGTSRQLDAGAHSLNDLGNVLREWVRSWSEVEL